MRREERRCENRANCEKKGKSSVREKTCNVFTRGQLLFAEILDFLGVSRSECLFQKIFLRRRYSSVRSVCVVPSEGKPAGRQSGGKHLRAVWGSLPKLSILALPSLMKYIGSEAYWYPVFAQKKRHRLVACVWQSVQLDREIALLVRRAELGWMVCEPVFSCRIMFFLVCVSFP